MPRTPLFGALVRALRLADRSNRTALPPDALLERAAATRQAMLSRRELLAATAAAGAAACAPRRPAALPAPDGGEAPVLVVGAGIAGLTATWRLMQAGIPVRLLEAQERTGGRMYSIRNHFADGQVAELGGELIDTGHVTIRALAAELGVELDDLFTDDAALAPIVWWFGGRAWSDAELIAAFRPLAARIRADLASTGVGDGDITAATPFRAEVLDRRSLAEWLAAAETDAWFRRLIEVAYVTQYGLEADQQSALNLLTVLPVEGDFELFGESDERYHTRGGNDLIVQRLAERVAPSIERGMRLEAVRQRADGWYEVSCRRNATSVTHAAPQVILALPFTLLRQVRLDVPLPEAKRRAIAGLGYGTNAKLMLGFASRPWRTGAMKSNGAVVTDLPFQVSWETSRLQPGRAGILTNFTGGRQGVRLGERSPAEQAAETCAGLEQIFAGCTAARAGMTEARFHWPSHPFALGSYSCYQPGQWTTMRGVEGAPVGGLHFAGEHTSLAAQGYMEGGCESGARAARAVLAARGRAAALGRRALLLG